MVLMRKKTLLIFTILLFSIMTSVAYSQDNLATEKFLGELTLGSEGSFLLDSNANLIGVEAISSTTQADLVRLNGFKVELDAEVAENFKGENFLKVESVKLAENSPRVDLQTDSEIKRLSSDITNILNEIITSRENTRGLGETAITIDGKLLAALREKEAEVYSVFEKADSENDTKTIYETIDLWAALSSSVLNDIKYESVTTDIPKSIYGFDDNFPPHILRTIQKQTQISVGIARKNGATPICTGILISAKYVLTAAHCLSQDDLYPDQIELVFNYVDDPENKKKIERVKIKNIAGPKHIEIDEIHKGKFGTEILDYVILEYEQQQAYEYQPCFTRETNRGDPLYSLGYPLGQPLKYHANGRVYLPYKVHSEKKRFGKFKLAVLSDEFTFSLSGYNYNEASSLEGVNLVKIAQNQADKVRAGLEKSYIERDGFRYLHLERPKIGVTLDLSGGDSGAPVFKTRGEQCIVGLLNLGKSDKAKKIRVSWNNNETILPIEAIISDLKESELNTDLVNLIESKLIE